MINTVIYNILNQIKTGDKCRCVQFYNFVVVALLVFLSEMCADTRHIIQKSGNILPMTFAKIFELQTQSGCYIFVVINTEHRD